MDTNREMAEAIVSNAVVMDWKIYLAFFAVSIIGSFVGAYLKSYGMEKAKNKAIQSDIKIIKEQLSETTLLTEGIRNDIEHSVWRKKELEILRRTKLEEYLFLLYTGNESLHDRVMANYSNSKETHNPLILNKADVLQKLYFPELADLHDDFNRNVAKLLKWMADGEELKGKAISAGIPQRGPGLDHMEAYQDLLFGITRSISEITKKGKEMADQLNA